MPGDGPSTITFVHYVLGNQIEEICRRYGLNEEDVRLVDELLAQWDKLNGLRDAQVKLAERMTEGHAKKDRLIDAMYEISKAFQTHPSRTPEKFRAWKTFKDL
jgi:DNA repair protein RadC